MPASYREFSPSPRLARYVECFWSREDQQGARGHCVFPDGCVDILFSTRNCGPNHLTLVGLMTVPLQVDEEAGRSRFGVRFRPGMAAAFLPEAAILSDKIEPLDSLWGAKARVLFERLAEAPGPLEMAGILEQSLRPLEPPDAVQRVLWQLPHSPLPLDRLVSDAGLSDRHFRRECVERTGVSPKYLRRIFRFREAVERIRAVAASPAQLNWAQLAAACHYYDQAHFIRDFQEFSGSTPGRFLQSLHGANSVESKNDEPAETRKPNRLH